MRMPPADAEIIARRGEIALALSRLVPGGVIAEAARLKAYESDGLTAYRQMPLAVVLPETTAQAAAVLRFCRREKVKVVPRGAGTSLSGGALPLADGIVLGLARFNRILEIDLANQCAIVQPGVTNLAVSRAVAGEGLYYAPDPSSQIACTIGGNIAENAGGVHCLKYGLTTNNLLGLEAVLMDGTIVRCGGRGIDPGAGYDLMGLVTGSEGLLAVVTEATVKLLARPPCSRTALIGFGSIGAAGRMVAGVIAGGLIPAGMEMMDKTALEAAEAYAGCGYPLEAEALLLIELDGSGIEVAQMMKRIERMARAAGAGLFRVSRDAAESAQFWAGRKSAFPAVGRLAPDYYCMDGTIPRGKLSAVLERISQMSRRYGLGVANVFHAGDGNLHPLILYDANAPGELEKAEAFGEEILRLCVEMGGVLTGEHGVGVEKRDLMELMFSAGDLDQQQRIKCAFDPEGLLNPGKMFPRLRRCAELGRMHVHGGRLPFPELERF